MNILYFGGFCDEELYKQDEKIGQKPYRIAHYTYEKAFCSEMHKINRMDIISVYPMENFPKNNFLFWRKKVKYKNTTIKYLKFINVPFLKQIMYFLGACYQIILWSIKNRKEKEKCIFSNKHYVPVSLAVVVIGKILGIKKIVTFTDLSLFSYSKQKIAKMKLYKKIIIKPYIKLTNKLQTSYDGYILFSEPMNKIVNPKNKPYIVMEGIYNSSNINLNPSVKKNAIAHAGTLNKEVAIDKILDVFENIHNENIELWLFGKGDMEQEIQKMVQQDSRIKYFGFLPRHEVFEYLKQAKLLVNLRDPKDIYTKYSFPSKTFEYMASGTPFFTTKLGGIPKEYYDYLYTTESYDSKEIALQIEQLLQNNEELNKKGKLAQEFIISKKNAREQIKKVNTLLKDKMNNQVAKKGT